MRLCKNPTVRYDTLTNRFPTYPKELRTAAFGSMIPAAISTTSKMLMDAHLVHQYEFTKVVTADNSKFKHKEAIESAIRYVEATRKGSLVKEPLKIAYLKQWELIDNSENAMPSVMVAANVWNEVYLKEAF